MKVNEEFEKRACFLAKKFADQIHEELLEILIEEHEEMDGAVFYYLAAFFAAGAAKVKIERNNMKKTKNGLPLTDKKLTSLMLLAICHLAEEFIKDPKFKLIRIDETNNPHIN